MVKVTVPVSDTGKPFWDVAVMMVVEPVLAGTGPRVDGLADRLTDC